MAKFDGDGKLSFVNGREAPMLARASWAQFFLSYFHGFKVGLGAFSSLHGDSKGEGLHLVTCTCFALGICALKTHLVAASLHETQTGQSKLIFLREILDALSSG